MQSWKNLKTNLNLPSTSESDENNCLSCSNYVLINRLFLCLIVIGIFYISAFPLLPDFLHVQSAHSKPVSSTGLTRALHELIHGSYEDAFAFNPYVKRVASFFGAQTAIRLIGSTRKAFTTRFIALDLLGTSLLFLWAFSPIYFSGWGG